MPSKKNIENLAEINKLVENSPLIILTGFKNVSVTQFQILRKDFRESEINLKVIKNNLLKLAVGTSDKKDLLNFIDGSLALITGNIDPAKMTKLTIELIKKNNLDFDVKGGILDTNPLTKDELTQLSKLPSKEILLSQLLSSVQSPIANLQLILQAPIQNLTTNLTQLTSGLLNVLNQRKEQIKNHLSKIINNLEKINKRRKSL